MKGLDFRKRSFATNHPQSRTRKQYTGRGAQAGAQAQGGRRRRQLPAQQRQQRQRQHWRGRRGRCADGRRVALEPPDPLFRGRHRGAGAIAHDCAALCCVIAVQSASLSFFEDLGLSSARSHSRLNPSKTASYKPSPHSSKRSRRAPAPTAASTATAFGSSAPAANTAPTTTAANAAANDAATSSTRPSTRRARS